MSETDLCARLQTSRKGLSATDAAQRLTAQGANEIKETKPVRRITILLRQFTSLIVWLLIVAAIVAWAMGEPIDAIAIIAIVLLNGVIGFYQEHKAEQSIAALRKMTAPIARVRRSGRSLMVPATQLVPGDVLEVEAGDIVAGDARLVEAVALRCVEAALTGESEPVNKLATVIDDEDLPLGDRTNMLFKGTNVAAGQGTALIVATGMKTELGRIADLIERIGDDERTPLQDKLESLGRLLVWVALGIVVLLFLLGLLRGTDLLEMFMTSVSLAVAAVPEGMPAVVTIALALGVMRMSRRRALVRRLPAVETLGSTNVICTDKTGTLTVGDRRHDGARVVCGWANLCCHRRRVRAAWRNSLRRQSHRQRTRGTFTGTGDHTPRMQQRSTHVRRGRVEGHRRSDRRRDTRRRTKSRRQNRGN
jgi:Ca2+-transporting ATPase